MKIKKLIVYACYACTCLLCSISIAKANCGHLKIHLVTKPGINCIATHVDIKHGAIAYSDIPTFINQNESVFTIKQESMHGPEINLTYNCGGADITVKSQQNFCLFKGGHISAKTSHPALVDIKIKKGQYRSDKPGNLYWAIKDKGSA